ncbi:hypothetical protein JCM8547_006768 [Rhodosporidiobolus lusitaniae]
MAPSKLPPCKVCGKKDAGKYSCPVDHLPYCTVKCFKQHKHDGCFSSQNYEPAPQPVLPVPEKKEQSDDNRPRKRLKDLHWPAEPDPTAWDDPLQREDIKPMRHSELEALATSPEIRRLLSRPSLLTPLSRLLQLPHHARTASLRTLLGLPAEPAVSTYRPEPGRRFATSVVDPRVEAEKERERERVARGGGRGGRGGRGGGRGGGGRGGGLRVLQSTEDERREVMEFAGEVMRIVGEHREGGRE